ncbi:MAG: ABC transporter permease, partial [Actinomycetota bacterium]|nr:ABC transporter permease [Actinomycetota bacterium]
AYTRLEIVEDLSYPMSVVMQFVTAVFPVVLYYFVAQLVPGRRANVGGDYYTFAVIGLAVAVVLQHALSGFGRRLEVTQNQGTFETMLVEPVPWMAVPVTLNIWRTAIGAMACGLMLLLGALLGADFRVAAIPAFVALVFLGVLACTAIGTLSASLQVLAKRSAPIISLYGLAATLLGGALFPVSGFPPWLAVFSYAVPHMYVIEGARHLLMVAPPSTRTFGPLGAVIALVVFNAVVFAVALPLFSRSLQYARKHGLLSGY